MGHHSLCASAFVRLGADSFARPGANSTIPAPFPHACLKKVAPPPKRWLKRSANPAAGERVLAPDPSKLPIIDNIVLDQLTPGTTELDLLRLLRATHSTSELRPADLPEVAARIETQLSQAKAAHRLQRLDPLTGLGNRAALLEQLNEYLTATSRAGRGKALTGRGAALTGCAVLLLDLDGFRRLNNSLGDGFGNDILIEASRRVRDAVEFVSWAEGSGIARIGDDEFAVIGPNVGRDALDEAASAILQRLKRPLIVQNLRLELSASIGIAVSGGEKASAEGLLRDAHLAMERARQLGGNRREFFETALRERAQNRMSLGLELRDAVEQNRLSVVYQPQMNLRKRRVEGFEALLRWRRTNGQVVPPVEFIPIAEDTGCIHEIGVWVLRQACRQLACWQEQFPCVPPLTMNVNVSVKQLSDPLFAGRVREILDETGIAPETLKLELTESALMSEIEPAREVLENLRSLRVGLILDDFGIGYSSLSYLRAAHFDSLKIAPCFLSKLGTDREARAIVESILNLAHALNMNVVAEGIETERQLRELEEMGCNLGQGFLFDKPLGRVPAENLLRRGFGVALAARIPALAPRSAA